jgi:hypothetical protein
LLEKKEENWVQCPASIYGSATCFLIVHLERHNQLVSEILQLYKESDPSNETVDRLKELLYKQENLEKNYSTRVLILFSEIWITFLIQGCLILKVWEETDEPDSANSGFCFVNVSLQLAAIAVLTLWTTFSFNSIWVEMRCYWARACKYIYIYIYIYIYTNDC